MKILPSPFGNRLFIVVLLLYGVSFAVLLKVAGQWEAIRFSVSEAVIALIGLGTINWILHDLPAKVVAVRKPKIELGLGLVAIAVIIALAISLYLGFGLAFLVAIFILYALPLRVLGSRGDSRITMGLHWPSMRSWCVVLVLIGVNLFVGFALGGLLPPSEFSPNSSATANQSGLIGMLGAPIRLLFVAAIPEELFFRAYMQPRLACYIPVGWAVLVQALLFGGMHLPQQIVLLHHSWPLALALTILLPTNGLIAGYLWWRTRSLPLLLVLHLFAFPRFT